MSHLSSLSGQTAVITGAGSGLGRALALACANAGMQLALSDVDEPGLADTRALLPQPTPCLTQRVDVSSAADVSDFCEATYKQFDTVNLLFNNAGVFAGGPLWSSTPQDWRWVLGVNLMGVVHGIQSFLPCMLESGAPGRVVNTASLAGLSSVPGSSAYCASKHAVVTLSECLHHELTEAVSAIGVSVLCPAFFQTGIVDAERNRPDAYAARNPDSEHYDEQLRAACARGRLTADDIADITLKGIAEDRFYILPHTGALAQVEQRLGDIVAQRAPSNPYAARA